MQNQDFTVVQDYITGLKALLYMNGNVGGERREYQEQRKPTPALVKDTVDLSDDYELIVEAAADQSGNGGPKFGPYLQNQRRAQAVEAATDILSTMNGIVMEKTISKKPVLAPEGDHTTTKKTITKMTPVESIVGCALKGVGAYKLLDRQAQVVALVNEVSSYSFQVTQLQKIND